MKAFSYLRSFFDKVYIRASFAFNLDATHHFVFRVIKIAGYTPRRE